MESTTCGSCGASFRGFTCPNCEAMRNAQQQADRQIEAVEEQTEALVRASADNAAVIANAQREAVREQKRTVSESWRLQAEAKADRAYELHKAELDEESVQLSLEAAQQDPGNIRTYMFASWGLKRLNRLDEARPLYLKQIQLLRSELYHDEPAKYDSVLSGLPTDEEMLSAFSVALRENAHRWKNIQLSLLEKLLILNRTEDARFFAAESMNGDVPKDDPNYFRLWVLAAEAARRVDVDPAAGLGDYVRSVHYARRWDLLTQFATMRSDAKWLSKAVTDCLSEIITEQYVVWRDDIERSLSQSAKEKSKSRTKGKFVARGWAAGIGVIGLTAFLAPAHTADSFLPAIAAGIATTSIFRSGLRSQCKREEMKELFKTENEKLRAIFPGQEGLSLQTPS